MGTFQKYSSPTICSDPNIRVSHHLSKPANGGNSSPYTPPEGYNPGDNSPVQKNTESLEWPDSDKYWVPPNRRSPYEEDGASTGS